MVGGVEEVVAGVESMSASWWSETYDKREDKMERDEAPRTATKGSGIDTERNTGTERKDKRCRESHVRRKLLKSITAIAVMRMAQKHLDLVHPTIDSQLFPVPDLTDCQRS